MNETNDTVEALGQYPTPVWLAEAIVERYFADLGPDDAVLEPSCGPGHFLQVIPPEVRAVGVEIDPELARLAHERTGRRVINADFRAAQVPFEPTAIIGNPPFQLSLIDTFLARAHELLPDGGRLGFVLPVYTFQTARRVVGYSERWTIQQEMIPRNIYQGLSLPLLFALFTKDAQRRLIGFAFYRRAADIQDLPKEARETLRSGRGSVWESVTLRALQRAGGEAGLETIYRLVADRRPTGNPAWQAQVRKVLQLSPKFSRTGRGRYQVNAEAIAHAA